MFLKFLEGMFLRFSMNLIFKNFPKIQCSFKTCNKCQIQLEEMNHPHPRILYQRIKIAR